MVAVAHVVWRGQQHAARWDLAQATGDLTAKPLAVKLANEVGFWALWALLATLAVTPLVRLQRRGGLPTLVGPVPPATWRRTLGLLSAILAALHMAGYGVLHPKSLSDLVSVWLELPWQWLGAVSALLLLPLVLTSNQLAMKALGRRWKSLHQLVYPATIAIVLHYALRSDATQWHWMGFAALAAGLLALRLGR
jgi:sulfoxide reductase heme-binding subunit YedZ